MESLRSRLPDVSGLMHMFPFQREYRPETGAHTPDEEAYYARMQRFATGKGTADALAMTALIAQYSGSGRDAAAGKAEAETVTAIAQTIANSKICRAKFGTYTGTGLSGQNHPNSVECGFCPAVLVLFRADGGQKTTVIRGVTACSSGIGSMNNYYTWGDSGVSRVSQTLDSDSGGYMASSQFNSSGKEYCYLVLGYDADWIKQKTAPSLSARG